MSGCGAGGPSSPRGWCAPETRRGAFTPLRAVTFPGWLLVAGEDRLHSLDRLIGRFFGGPLVNGDARHGLAPDVLVVDLGVGRVLPVLEGLVVAVLVDHGGHRDVGILLALGPLVPRSPEGILRDVGEGRVPAAVGGL